MADWKMATGKQCPSEILDIIAEGKEMDTSRRHTRMIKAQSVYKGPSPTKTGGGTIPKPTRQESSGSPIKDSRPVPAWPLPKVPRESEDPKGKRCGTIPESSAEGTEESDSEQLTGDLMPPLWTIRGTLRVREIATTSQADGQETKETESPYPFVDIGKLTERTSSMKQSKQT